jgi:tetratricopeptide (TPR) repeat protein
MSPRPPAVKVFISYAHEDEEWRRKLDAHLSLLEREGVLDVWHDRRLLAGEEWAEAIDDRLRSADLVLLMVSADFIRSDYCYGREMTTALAQDEAGRTRVVPIIVRRCDWETAPFGKLQALPRDNLAVATHPRGPDEALTEVAKELRRIAVERPPAPPIPPRRWWSRHRRRLAAGAGALAALALAVAFTVSSAMVSEGRRDLRVGAYDAARTRFARAAAVNPLDARARRGLRLSGLGLMTPDLVHRADDLARELERLERSDPQDPQVLMFRGDLALDGYRRAPEPRKLDAAVAAYRAAIAREPAFPEARAHLAHLHRLRRELPAAERQLREAVAAGGAAARSPRYQHDLASVVAAQGRVSEALDLYEGNGEFVPSAVEAGMLLWTTTASDALARARSKLAGALDRPERLQSGGNEYAWFLTAGDEGVYLGRPAAKTCFTTLALAATERMMGETSSAAARLRSARAAPCDAVQSDAALVVCARLAGAQAAAPARVDETRGWLGCPASPR